MGRKKQTREELQKLTYAERVDYYSHINNLLSINNGNAKTGIGCLTMSMPPISCRTDAPCKKGCYCMKGHQVYPTVVGAYYRNWRLWNEDPINFEKQLEAFITFSGAILFRYNDAGEIPDEKFLAMMFRIAEKLPEVKFLAYTKKYEMINEFLDEGNKIPNNLTIRFSYWDKDWEVPNPYNLPTAYVDFKDTDKNPIFPNKTFSCPAIGGSPITCSSCKVCWNKAVKSVKFHQH